jgi:serine/threonine protein kinase
MDKDAFATMYVEAIPLSRIEDRRPPDVFFDQLARLFHQVHALGVAHGDSHHSNVLLDASGRPYLVDFAIAQFADGSLVGRWLYRQAVLVDRRNIAKLKYKYGPHLFTEDDRITLTAPRLHRVVRAFVHSLRRCLKGIRKNSPPPHQSSIGLK